MIKKLSSEFNKFKNFGTDLNEANKTANKAKLTTKKAENIVKKGKQDLKEIKNKDKEKASSNRLWAYTGENFILPSASKNLSPA